MHRIPPICLTLLTLALLAVQPVAAGGARQRNVERMTQEFERLFQPLIGAVEARDLVFADHGNGFVSLSYSLGPADREGLTARGSQDGLFQTLACGHMAAEPTNPATMVTAVISDLRTEYKFWWTVVNKSEVDETRKTSVKISGPEGFEILAGEEVLYGANAVHLVWFNPETPFPVSGIYTHRVSVKTGGKAIYRFFAEAASTTTLER